MRKISFKILSVSVALISHMYAAQATASHGRIWSPMEEPKVKSLFKHMMQMVPDTFSRNIFAQKASELLNATAVKDKRLALMNKALAHGDHTLVDESKKIFLQGLNAAALETSREVARVRQAEQAKAAALRQAEEAKAKKEARRLAAAKAAAEKAAAPSYSSAFLNVLNGLKRKLSKPEQGNLDAYVQLFPEHFNTPTERLDTLATLHTYHNVAQPKVLKTALHKLAQQPLTVGYIGGVETVPGYTAAPAASFPKATKLADIKIIPDYAEVVAQPESDMPPAHLMKSYIGGIDTIPGYADLAKTAAQTATTAKVMSASPLARFASGLFSFFR